VMWAEAQAGDPDLKEAFQARDARFHATLTGYLRGDEARAGLLLALLRGVALVQPADARAQVRALLSSWV
jgi:hypothetical protein